VLVGLLTETRRETTHRRSEETIMKNKLGHITNALRIASSIAIGSVVLFTITAPIQLY